jgi:hypothetical protein
MIAWITLEVLEVRRFQNDEEELMQSWGDVVVNILKFWVISGAKNSQI